MFNHVGLLPDDRDEMSHGISGGIINFALEDRQGHLDIDNLEYKLHKDFVNYCTLKGRKYTSLQINDVVQIQITLVVYIASLLQK